MADKTANPRPQFGNRMLTDPSKVFEHNAWDNVEWGEEQEEEAQAKIAENAAVMVDEQLKEKYENEANQFWDEFYTQHQNRFFKDRHWLFTEFPELDTPTESEAVASSEMLNNECYQKVTQVEEAYPGVQANKRILEVGCGVGNTVFPILEANNDCKLFVYCCDFSQTAVDLVKQHPGYACGRCHAFVCDVTQTSFEYPFPDSSLDIIILIFVLSAIRPDRMQDVICRLAKLLKPGGVILFRDYGRYDMAQLRFKKGRCLSDNFYVRGDGTRVYFFTQDELAEMFRKAGLTEEQNYVDRRLQVNRGRQLRMYRIWIQCKYRKPV